MAAQKLEYASVRDSFKNIFVPKKNSISMLNLICEHKGATVSTGSFFTALYALAEDCEYGALRDC